MKLTITKFFEDLGAPLTNQQWSWGAVRKDGTVFFRVWDDEQLLSGDDGREYAVLDSPGHWNSTHGATERAGQMDLVRAGAPCYLVLLKGDPDWKPPQKRKIISFNHHVLLVGGRIIKRGDLTLIEITGHTTPMAVRAQAVSH